MTRNLVEAALGKRASELTRDDIVRYIEQEGIQMLNFMYPAADGRLKTLNFVINDRAYLDTLLSCGERVDGSSLFPSISASSSDLYVIPRFTTAFRDPFAEIPTLTMLCSYFDKDGKPASCGPRNTLKRACQAFKDVTGMDFEAMGELEYYVISPDCGLFPATDQKGYHESMPFAKFNDFRTKAMWTIASIGGKIKYGHSEVGNFTHGGMIYEQNEIEFLPQPALQAADQLMLAKWVIRNLAYRENLNVTFSPKITAGKAGSGLHIHMRFTRDGKNMVLNDDRTMSDDARRAIAGLMTLAAAITAFGNTNPTSYMRLVPHQEAPTAVCWGDCNRSVLVRVPLGWTSGVDMCEQANPGDKCVVDPRYKQTFEMRSPDGSADLYQLIAGLCVAARVGFEMDKDEALKKAADTYVSVNIHDAENAAKLAALDALPTSCAQSARRLEQVRDKFEARGVFHKELIDGIIKRLEAQADENLHGQMQADPTLMERLVKEHFNCG